MKYDEVKLFDPSEWKTSVGELASEEDKKWNWFICSKPNYDRKTGYHVIDVSPDVAFYCEKSGRTLRVDSGLKKRPRLLVLDDPRNKLNFDDTREAVKFAAKIGYDGVTKETKSKVKQTPICEGVTFIFRDGILSSVTSSKNGDQLFPERCGIVKYVKTHNSQLRSVNSRILTCSEIDELLSNNSCETVSIVLYNLLEI